MKNFLFFLLLLSCKYVPAQPNAFRQEMERLDSLVFYNQLPEAEKLCEQLLQKLQATPKERLFIDQQLSVMLHVANIKTVNGLDKEASEILLQIVDLSQSFHLPLREYEAHLAAAVIFESHQHLDLCRERLDKAFLLYKTNNIATHFSTFCVRNSAYYFKTRNTGYHFDSALHYARLALDYAEKYQVKNDIADANYLLGQLLALSDYKASISHYRKVAQDFLLRNRFMEFYYMILNIAHTYLKNQQPQKALPYCDSLLAMHQLYKIAEKEHYYELKYQIYDSLRNYDSAYRYFQLFHDVRMKKNDDKQAIEIKNVTERYENNKKELVIKNKNMQVLVIGSLLITITLLSIFLVRKNRKINTQNKVISRQVVDLTRILEQKQVLLSELQHRVKNNLQHVISILEIQKESVDFNNIEELIRGNQNRIHSMALLHKKLNVTESVNEVALKRYITELAALVKESYDSPKRKISMNVVCDINTMSIEKALPIGLIIVELVSNSMKHAFKKRASGRIQVSLTKHTSENDNQFFYSDNGSGFDFKHPNGKGLGLEILKGLIDQLDASVDCTRDHGFNLRLYFK